MEKITLRRDDFNGAMAAAATFRLASLYPRSGARASRLRGEAAIRRMRRHWRQTLKNTALYSVKSRRRFR